MTEKEIIKVIDQDEAAQDAERQQRIESRQKLILDYFEQEGIPKSAFCKRINLSRDVFGRFFEGGNSTQKTLEMIVAGIGKETKDLVL